MKLYLVVRQGSPTDVDGPDGPDTNVLVRAKTVEEAGMVADTVLRSYASHQLPVGRPVQDLCHQITELGEDASADPEPAIIHGPWVLHAYIYPRGYRKWHRDSPAAEWSLSESE